MARTASLRSNNNRRARVDDDEDEERDRRHPSQRIQSPSGTPTTRSVTSTPLPQNQPGPSSIPAPQLVGPNPFHTIVPGLSDTDAAQAASGPHNPFNFLRDFVVNSSTNPTSIPTAAPTEGAAAHNPAQGPSTRTFTHRTDDGFMTVEVSTGPIMFGLPMANPPAPVSQPPPTAQGDAPPAAQQQQPQQPLPNPPHGPPGSLTDLLARLGVPLGPGGAMNLDLGGLGLPLGLFGDLQEKDDPERARKLVDGLEEVPVGLVRRLERVGGSSGGAGEDDGRGGDGMCAICWDRLLDAEGEGFGKEVKKEDLAQMPAEGEASSSSASTSEAKEEDPAEKKYPKIVSLPCAHVFHADCLLPWFSRPRHTTCPTCRFNIDPHNLTYVSAARRRQMERDQAHGTAGHTPAGDADANNNNNIDNAPNPNPTTPATTTEGDAPIPPVNPLNVNVGIGNRGFHVRRTNHGVIISSNDEGLDELVEQVNNQGPLGPLPPQAPAAGAAQNPIPAPAQPQQQPQTEQDGAATPPPPPPPPGPQGHPWQTFVDSVVQRVNQSLAAAGLAHAQLPQQPHQQPQYTFPVPNPIMPGWAPVPGPTWPGANVGVNANANAGVQAQPGPANANANTNAASAPTPPQAQPQPQAPQAPAEQARTQGMAPGVPDGRLPTLPSLPVPMNVGIRTTPIVQTINLGGFPVVINGNAVPGGSVNPPAGPAHPPPAPPQTHPQINVSVGPAANANVNVNPPPPASIPLHEGGTEVLRLTFDMVFNPALGAVPRPANLTQAPAQQQQAQPQPQAPTPVQVPGAPGAPQPNPRAQQTQPQQPFIMPNAANALNFMMQGFEGDFDQDQMIDDVLREAFDPSVVDGINRRAREQAQHIMDSVRAGRDGRPLPPPLPEISIEEWLGGPLPRAEGEQAQAQMPAQTQPTQAQPAQAPTQQRQQQPHNGQPRMVHVATDPLFQIIGGVGDPAGGGIRIASGSGRTVGEAFQQIFAGMGAGAQQGAQAQTQAPPPPSSTPSTAAPHDTPPTGAQTQPQQPQPQTGLQDILRMFAPPQQGPTPAPGATPATTLEGVAAQTQRLLQQLAQEQQQLEAFVRALFASPTPGQQTPAPTTAGVTPAAGGPSTEQQQDFEDFFRQAAPTPAERAQQPGQPGGTPFRFFDLFSGMRPHPVPERPKGPWVLPPPPGLTLRQRVERREREAGLRCHDVSCGLGPSDEDPFGAELGEATVLQGVKQLSVRVKGESGQGENGERVCEHTFHSGCLVSAERVALKGADAIVDGDENIEVSCPVCRHAGCMTKEEWEEGVHALTLA
ncbi:unnamed protein product [Cyclocybe aegerita]|uniref:RING-type domain-containing protein n=1 Tax=Cyclocybe aegerita TaxID=1973307 RepID=A0A8S0VYW3_CYCAE|nr:unnamed protein product [Cyclocybe aegerita]